MSKQFESLKEFKSAAEFFPSGRIIPQRILKSNRKHKSKIVFGSDSWFIPTPAGYIGACDTQLESDYLVLIKFRFDGVIVGSPYVAGGGTTILGSYNKTQEQLIAEINRMYEDAYAKANP
jgi:hypothetical protein